MKDNVRRWIALVLVITLVVVMPLFTVGLAGNAAYDLQANLVGIQRCAAFILWIASVLYIRNMISGDDLEQDYARIDAGNVATGIYRGLELFGVCVAGAMLIAKV